jgi:hypothetical protein
MHCELAHVCNDDRTVYIVEASLFIVGNMVRERIDMYGLLNDADSQSDYSYVVANDRKICGNGIGKGIEGCNRDLIYGIILAFVWRTEEAHDNPVRLAGLRPRLERKYEW